MSKTITACTMALRMMRTERMEAEPDVTHRLMRALYRAGVAFVDPAQLDTICDILARPSYLDASAALIRGAISDRILFAKGSVPIHIPDFMFQHREAANFPWVSQAAWLYAQMAAAGHVTSNEADYARAQGVFRPDIYRAALRPLGVPLPGASSKLEKAAICKMAIGVFSYCFIHLHYTVRVLVRVFTLMEKLVV